MVEGGTTSNFVHLLRPEGEGGTSDRTVSGLPSGLKFGIPVAGDETSTVLAATTVDGERVYLLVDPTTAAVSSYTAPIAAADTSRYLLLTPEYLGWYTSSGSVTVVPRSDPGAEPVEVAGSTSAEREPGENLAIVGDWLVYEAATGSAIKAVPLAGGNTITLLAKSTYRLSSASDGTAVAVGGAGNSDWGIRRITEGADGAPVVSTVKALSTPATVEGLTLAQGALVTTDSATGTRYDYVRTLSVQGTPTYGSRSRLVGSESAADCTEGYEGCRALHALGDGSFSRVVSDDGTNATVLTLGTGDYNWSTKTVPSGGQITDAAGSYILYTVPGTQKQYVFRVGYSGYVVERTASAAAVWGGRLWTPGATAGTVTALDLATQKVTGTVDTGSACVPDELQVLGRWIYWACAGSGRVGVYDSTAKTSVGLPTDQALLGDGYVVTHDKAAGKLVLTDFHTGTAVSSVIGDLPDNGEDQRRLRWDVDKFSGHVAYADSSEQVHVVATGVQAQALTALQEDTYRTDLSSPGQASRAWLAGFWLSKPATSWKLVVKNKAGGKTAVTLTGGETRGWLTLSWQGLTAQGDVVPNGTYTWSLTVQPSDGVGPAYTDNGSIRLTGGTPVWRDFDQDDGFGELFALDKYGYLVVRKGTGTGQLSSSKLGGIWWGETARLVPFGDLTNDGCNDLLVRMASGNLFRKAGDCGSTDNWDSVKLGTGFNQYDILTSPGDITGDGRADLIARNSSTGAVYLLKATSTGKLSSRVKLYSSLKGYKKIIGVGDLNGDGFGDLLAQDKSNELWRYNGTGSGTFKARVKVFNDWGSSYNVIVGVGDITGDGRADLVSRDTSGNLWRNSGNGKGSFGGRTKIATGWQGYKGLF